MPKAGVMINQQWLPGFICYGVAIGSVDYVKHIMAEKVDTLVDEVDQVMELLEGDSTGPRSSSSPGASMISITVLVALSVAESLSTYFISSVLISALHLVKTYCPFISRHHIDALEV